MKIFGIGYPKTGTTTLHECFNILGMRPCKTFDFFLSYWQVHRSVARILDNERFRKIIQNSDFFSDWPFFLIYRELDEVYPGSKFILTLRSSRDKWEKSNYHHGVRKQKSMTRDEYTNYIEARKDLPSYDYDRHIMEVKDYFRKRTNDLLIMCMEKGEQWSVLCNFLDLPIPNTPFPHLNKSD